MSEASPSPASPYPLLFSPFKIGSLEIKNRIVMTAMEVGLARFSGNPSPASLHYFAERAKGGVGLIITGITRVDNRTGVSAPRQLSLANHWNLTPMKRLTHCLHEHQTAVFAQLHHPGRQNYSALIGDWPMMMGLAAVVPGFASLFKGLVRFYNRLLQWRGGVLAPSVVAPSAVPCSFLHTKTRALRRREIRALEKKFIRAALRAKAAGFDGVELHAAHGYLIQQFLSTRTNRRTDEYGGSFENRMRFLKNILTGIKAACGAAFPVSVRLSVEEFYSDEGPDRGITLEEGVRMAQAIEQWGADALNVSSASYETMNRWLEPVTYAPGWRAYLAKAVRSAVSIPVIAANLIRSPAQAEEQLRSGVQDAVGLGRPLLADPLWPRKAQTGQTDSIVSCINCLHCFESLNQRAWAALPLECALNPFIGFEEAAEHLPACGVGKKAVVVGAGAAGLKAAQLLALQSFSVVVFEQHRQAGGQLLTACRPPHKERLFQAVIDLKTQCDRLSVDFRFQTPATPEAVSQCRPDLVVLATGSLPLTPPIPGSNLPHVFSVEEVLSDPAQFKTEHPFPSEGKGRALQTVVVGSGLTGLETACFLAAKGHRVTVVEMLESLAPGAYHQNRDDVLEALRRYETRFLISVQLKQIRPTEVVLFHLQRQEEQTLPCDAVVLALGNRKNDSLLPALRAVCPDVRVVGDALQPGRIFHAVHSAARAVLPPSLFA